MHYLLRKSALALCVPVIFFACATVKTDRLLPTPRPLGASIPTVTAPAKSADAEKQLRTTIVSSETLTLHDALTRALMHNPQLAASSWEVRAGAARTDQAQLYPNPEIEVEIEEFGGSKDQDDGGTSSDSLKRFDGAETTVKFSQLIELGGKRSKRTRAATLEHSVLGWDFEAKRLDLITEVSTSFIEVLALQKRLLLVGDLVQISEDLFNTVAERVHAGKVAPIEETNAQIALANVQIERQRVMRDLESARKKLAAAWGSTALDFKQVTGEIENVSSPPSIEQLLNDVSQNPDIARLKTEVEQREAALEIAKADRIPDLTLGAGIKYLNESDDETYLMALSLPLPLLNRNQGGVREASYNISRAKEEAAAAEVKVATALHETYQNLLSAFDEVTTLRNIVLPGAHTSFNAAREGYREGKFSYLIVLDAQRTLIETEQEYVNALIDYHTSKSSLERLVAKGL
jgi:cobalt-zinc-cadmium efflux system outer membrane protein